MMLSGPAACAGVGYERENGWCSQDGRLIPVAVPAGQVDRAVRAPGPMIGFKLLESHDVTFRLRISLEAASQRLLAFDVESLMVSHPARRHRIAERDGLEVLRRHPGSTSAGSALKPKRP